ncbi:MAG: 50S ribosomal protein L25 [Endomicrobiales bacterium]
MKEVNLEVETREISTKHRLKELRASGKVPAVFYGHTEKAVSLAVGAKNLDEAIRAGGSNVLISLKVGNDTKTAIVKEIQRDVISQSPIHVDFQAVSLKEKIEVSVPLHIVGIAPGVKLSGGVLEHILREMRVRCLPTDIPHAVNVDVSSLEINHSLAVRDLPVLEGVEYLADPSSIIVNIVAPTVLEEAPAPGTEAAAAGTAAAEPEVISKGKKEEEEGAEGAPAAAGEKKGEKPKGGEKK